MRVISDRQAMQLKAATRRAIDMAGGPDSFEHVTRVRQGQLSKYGLAGEEHAATFAPIDVALEADIEAGAPLITEMMAKLQGYRLVRDKADQPEEGLTHRDISALNAELGDVSRVALDALDDGKVDARERRDLMRELGDLKAQIALIEGKLGGGA